MMECAMDSDEDVASAAKEIPVDAKESESKENVETSENDKIKAETIVFGYSKKLPTEDMINILCEGLCDLKNIKEWDSEYCLVRIKAYSRSYWDYKPHRPEIANNMVENGFAAQVYTMLKYFNGVGIFKTDDVWFPTYYTLNATWNFSDTSYCLCQSLTEVGIVDLLARNLDHQPYLTNLQSKNVYFLMKASLSILQNIARHSDLVHRLHDAKIKDLLTPFLKSDDDFLRTTATMVLTNIITEEENKMLEDTGAIPYMVKSISKALANKKTRRYRGFTPTELVDCLSSMAVNDINKLKIVDEGLLPLLVAMMQHTNEEEQIVAAKTVWTLCFDKSLIDKIKNEEGMLTTLTALKGSSGRAQHNAEGALWMLHDGANQIPEENTRQTGELKDHIFISYPWASQDVVVKIKDKLKSEGYRVWLDVEQMGGSTLEAMASAVENASVVLICASEKYKQSPNARTEAEYTFQLKRPIVPLMMQRYYKPDGWLGMLLGAKFYVNFDGKYEFDHAYKMLLKELQGRGKDGTYEPVTTLAPVMAETMATAPLTHATPHTRLHSWSEDKVQKWAEENIASLAKNFSQWDGKRLGSLLKLKHEAPEFLYQSLKDDWKLNLLDILDLIAAMDSLAS